jgi:Na+/melibiose symporter and related transporters
MPVPRSEVPAEVPRAGAVPVGKVATPALSFGTKFAFGVGQMAEGIKNSAFSTILLIYYNQVLGLPGSLAGLAIMIALCFDAITDPLAGSFSDNLRSRWGRRSPSCTPPPRPWRCSSTCSSYPPGGLGEWELFAWLTVMGVLTRGAMTLYHVPHLALGAELRDEYEERTSFVSFRQVFRRPRGRSRRGGSASRWFFSDQGLDEGEP